jgi:hypothetical protein
VSVPRRRERENMHSEFFFLLGKFRGLGRPLHCTYFFLPCSHEGGVKFIVRIVIVSCDIM